MDERQRGGAGVTHDPGEGPKDPKAKERAAQHLKDPKYHAEKGSKRDLGTVDDELDPQHKEA
jgi:hypothetical protein